jgi:hypothetical protein
MRGDGFDLVGPIRGNRGGMGHTCWRGKYHWRGMGANAHADRFSNGRLPNHRNAVSGELTI